VASDGDAEDLPVPFDLLGGLEVDWILDVEQNWTARVHLDAYQVAAFNLRAEV
jgi:hypothetical protein